MLTSALDHYARQQQITARGLAAIRRARWGPLPRLTALVALFQMAAAKDAADSVPLMLAEQGIDTDAAGIVVPAAIAGVASDGRPLVSLLELSRTEAWDLARFERMVVTQLQDAARSSASIATAASPRVTGYVRMLNPPSCSRCAILAGREYRWNDGFQRHPGCDCRHVPVSEDTSDSLTTDPKAYFDSLPTAADLAERYPDLTVKMRREAGIYSQEDIFTKAGARAIRDGANIGEVVNVRRGMSTAQTASGRRVLAPVDRFGQRLYVTTEGTTVRGSASRKRTGRRMSDRLMPESIYAIADSREDAIRLLRLNGYIR